MPKLPNGPMRLISLVEKSITEMPIVLNLPPEVIDRLHAVDAQLAACYASMDDLCDRFDTLTAEARGNRRLPSVEEELVDDDYVEAAQH